MPNIISRQQAMDEITSSLKPGECLACYLLGSNHNYVVHQGELSTVLLSRYPRTWGQTMILLNNHKTSISEISSEEWQELTDYVRKASICLETVLKPLRCYIASLGATKNLPYTCPHLHFNVLPVYNAEDKPSDIFTWQHGVYAAEEWEWKNLLVTLKQEWERNFSLALKPTATP